MPPKRLGILPEPALPLPEAEAVGAVDGDARGSLEAGAAAQHPQGHRRLDHTRPVCIPLALTRLRKADISW
jgi:hypothetical protein